MIGHCFIAYYIRPLRSNISELHLTKSGTGICIDASIASQQYLSTLFKGVETNMPKVKYLLCGWPVHPIWSHKFAVQTAGEQPPSQIPRPQQNHFIQLMAN